MIKRHEKYQVCNQKPLFGEQPIQWPEEKEQKEKKYSQKNKKTTNPNKSGVNSDVPESSCLTNVSVVVLLNIP